MGVAQIGPDIAWTFDHQFSLQSKSNSLSYSPQKHITYTLLFHLRPDLKKKKSCWLQYTDSIFLWLYVLLRTERLLNAADEVAQVLCSEQVEVVPAHYRWVGLRNCQSKTFYVCMKIILVSAYMGDLIHNLCHNRWTDYVT